MTRQREGRQSSSARYGAAAAPARGAPSSGGAPSGSGSEEIPAQRSGEPGPDSPLELEPGDWKSTLRRTLTEIKEDRVTLVAAGMAYYFFLAIFPALIAFVGIMGLVDAKPTGLIDSIESTLPQNAARVLVEPMNEAGKTAEGASLVAAITGIAIALWSASSGMVALQAGLNVAYDVPRDRKFIGKRAIALVLMIATGLLGGVPSPFLTFGDSAFFVILGWVLTIVAVMVLFSVFYFLGPNRETPTWQWVSAGGVVGALLWVVASVLFLVYISNFSNYGKTYGSYAGVVVLILWLFLTSIAVLIGGELNAELERQAQTRSEGS